MARFKTTFVNGPRAWVYQDSKQLLKHGSANISWYVGWFNLEGKKRGKSCGPGDKGKILAEKLAKSVHEALKKGCEPKIPKYIF